MECQGVAHRALRTVRRHGVNFSRVSEAVLESGEPFGLNAVIVGEQDDHGRILAKKRLANK
jgi:hypothetical protein